MSLRLLFAAVVSVAALTSCSGDTVGAEPDLLAGDGHGYSLKPHCGPDTESGCQRIAPVVCLGRSVSGIEYVVYRDGRRVGMMCLDPDDVAEAGGGVPGRVLRQLEGPR